MKTPHVTIAKRYAREVASGRRVAGLRARQACQRFLDDLERDDLEFRPRAAERPCQFIEKLPHIKGRWVRRKERIELRPWQCFIVVAIFGFYRPDGLRRTRQVYVEVARKNGKSTLLAGIGLYCLCADDEPGAEVYSGATTEKQAWEVFGPARKMALAQDALRARFDVEVNAKNLHILQDGSKFEPIIGDPGDGAMPSCAIVDEFHEHKKANLYQTMITGMGARENPIILVITTAGEDISGPCYDMRADVLDILDGTVTDDDVFGIVYSMDEDDDWTSETALKKANPNLGVSISHEWLRARRRQAMRSASQQAVFKTKHLDVWVRSRSAWLNMEQWHRCANPSLNIDDFAGVPCRFGLDLASKCDFTAFAQVFHRTEDDGRRHYYAFARYFLPEDVVHEGENHSYAAWLAEGWLDVTEGNELDFDYVEAVVREYLPLEPTDIGYDPWRATQLSQGLRKEGAPMVEIGPAAKNFSPGMRELEAAIASGRFHHDGNPITAWMMSNVVAGSRAGLLYPMKEREENKIDGPVALFMPMTRIVTVEDPYAVSADDIEVM